MKRKDLLRTLTLGALAAGAFAGCGPDQTRSGTPGGSIRGTGTVRHIQLEGGFFGIVADDGQRYDPINLPEAFRKEGLRVRFEAKPRPDLAGFHMWGTLVEIVKIAAL